MRAFNALIRDKETKKQRVVTVFGNDVRDAYRHAVKIYPMQVVNVRCVGAKL